MITTPHLLTIKDPQVSTDVVLVLLFGVSAQLPTKPQASAPLPGMNICLPLVLKCDSEFLQTVTFLKVFSSRHYATLYITVLSALGFELWTFLRTSVLFNCLSSFSFRILHEWSILSTVSVFLAHGMFLLLRSWILSKCFSINLAQALTFRILQCDFELCVLGYFIDKIQL